MTASHTQNQITAFGYVKIDMGGCPYSLDLTQCGFHLFVLHLYRFLADYIFGTFFFLHLYRFLVDIFLAIGCSERVCAEMANNTDINFVRGVCTKTCASLQWVSQ